VHPVGDRVLVKVDQEESKTTGGILLPSSAQKKPTAGTVVSTAADAKAIKVLSLTACCDGRYIAPYYVRLFLLTVPDLFVLQVGDKVIYSKYAGTEVQVQGSEHVLLKVWHPMTPCICHFGNQDAVKSLNMLNSIHTHATMVTSCFAVRKKM
jgi:chaperonin GroES